MRVYSAKLLRPIGLRLPVWTLWGPASVALSLLVLVFNATAFHAVLGGVAVGGLACCWKWQRTGLYMAAGALVSVWVLGVAMNPSIGLSWSLGLVIALGLALFMTTLSAEEVQEALLTFQNRVREQSLAVCEAETKLKTADANLAEEKRVLLGRVEQLVREKGEVQAVLDIARTEFLSARNENDKLLNELFSAKQDIAKVEEQLEDFTPLQEEARQLRHMLHQMEQRKPELVIQKEVVVEKQVVVETVEIENPISIELQAHVTDLREQLKLQTEEKELLEKTINQLQATAEATVPPIIVSSLDSEEGRALRRTQGLYRQLRDQFEEKSSLLDQTRRDLFAAQLALETYQKQTEEAHLEETEELFRYLSFLEQNS